MDFKEEDILDQVMIHEADWAKAVSGQLEIEAEDIEANWGLSFLGYAFDDISCDFLNYRVVDKHKFFLAKIKHGF